MSNQQDREQTTINRKIESVQENVKLICAQAKIDHEKSNSSKIYIDDGNTQLQSFFHRFEELLLFNFKTRKYLTSSNTTTKGRSYWDFFSTALKEGKELYNTIAYVMNCQEIKTSTGRGRLFLRFCLQNHRLGDVIQFSFMLPRVVKKFYYDKCFWMNPTILDNIVQTLYQLNDIQFDLLSIPQAQLELCWPTLDFMMERSRPDSSRSKQDDESNSSDQRTTGSNRFLDNSDSLSVVSIPIVDLSSWSPGFSPNQESSDDEEIENSPSSWSRECKIPTESVRPKFVSTENVEVQCSIENEILQNELQTVQMQTDSLQQQVTSLNLQLLALSTENSTADTKITKYEKLLNEIEEKSRRKDEQITDLNLELLALSKEKSTAETTIKEFENRLKEIEETSQTKDERINKLQEEVDGLKRELSVVSTAGTELTKYEKNFKQFEETNREKDEKLARLEKEFELLSKENSTKEIKMAKYEQTLREFEEKNKAKDERIDSLREKVTGLNLQISSLSKENSTGETEIKKYETMLQKFEEILRTKDEEIRRLTNELENGNGSADSIKEKFDDEIKMRDDEINRFSQQLEKTLENWRTERISIETERKNLKKIAEQLEKQVQEKTLDYEDMKRRLVRAVQEKAELFSSIHNYEIKLQAEQAKIWVPDEQVSNCTNCKILFSWRVRKHHCRQCQKIFCHNCSNNWLPGSKERGSLYRICEICNEKLFKESLLTNPQFYQDMINRRGIFETTDNFDLRFEVRSERLRFNDDSLENS